MRSPRRRRPRKQAAPKAEPMAHERDFEHRRATPSPQPPLPESEANPDRVRREHPGGVPAEPIDPQLHPGRDRAQRCARPR